MSKIKVVENIRKANDQIAAENRRLLDAHGILAINLMASPGAGKTSLLMRTIEALGEGARCAAVDGDTASRVDADRIATTGVPVVQINTGGGCSLNATMMQSALEQLPLDEIDLLFIENVGNLICPAGVSLGEHLNAVITSVPEGDDKPFKYPGIFTVVDAVVINKLDLLPYLEYGVSAFCNVVRGLNPKARIFQTSCKTGEGIDEWARWLTERRT